MQLKGAYIDSIWEKCKEKMLTKKSSSSSSSSQLNGSEEGETPGLPADTTTPQGVTAVISNLDLVTGASLANIQQAPNAITTTTILQEKDVGQTDFLQAQQTIPLNVELTGVLQFP